jgi:hypothetical protein
MKSSPTKKIMNTSGTMMQADFDFDLHTNKNMFHRRTTYLFVEAAPVLECTALSLTAARRGRAGA